VTETPAVTEVIARSGKGMTCKTAAEATNAAAHVTAAEAANMTATEAAAHMTATTTEAATAGKRGSGQSPCESGDRC